MEWAIEVGLKAGMTVVACMSVGPEGDLAGVTAAECGLRMAKAGAHVGESPHKQIGLRNVI